MVSQAVRTKKITFHIGDKEKQQLVSLAEADGVNMSDYVRKMIREEFKKQFGTLLVCSMCQRRDTTKNFDSSKWSLGKNEGVLCPKCKNKRSAKNPDTSGESQESSSK